MPARDFIGAGRIQKIAREGALLGAVHIALVVQRDRIPACARIHAPAHVRDRIGFAVAPSGEIVAHQLGVQRIAFDLRHVITDDR
ncbi:hypothetical protein D3C83_145420 [compost metagenome]